MTRAKWLLVCLMLSLLFVAWGFRDAAVLWLGRRRPPPSDAMLSSTSRQGDWTMWRGDAQRTGVQPQPGTPVSGRVAWQFAAGDWSLPVDQLGPGAEWYEYNPSKAKQLLAQAGYPKGFKTTMEFTTQYSPAHTEGAQLRVDMLREVGIDVTLVPKDYGYYITKTFRGDYAEMGYGLMGAGLEPEVYIKSLYDPESSMNSSHVNDPKMAELLHKQQITKDIEQRREVFAEIQRHAADRVYYVYASAAERLASWQPYVKNYNTNLGFDYGGRMLEAWIDKA